jgi:hypothetical protein
MPSLTQTLETLAL